MGGAKQSGLANRTRQLASMTALLNFRWAPLLCLGGLVFYFMLEGASTTAGGCEMLLP